MMNVIVNEELYDKEFVNNWCHGFADLRQRVQEYPPEKAAEITWLPVDHIKEAARLYATIKPAAMHHRVAIEHNVNTSQTLRALCTLIALTGNIDVMGGNLFSVGSVQHKHVRKQENVDNRIVSNLLRRNRKIRGLGGDSYATSWGTCYD
jgi:anaerobic selenocysteine-containing dehydrogenase